MRGQISVYIIIGIVLALSIIFFVTLRTSISGEQIPQRLVPVFEYYESCIRSELTTAVNLAGAGGGRIAVKGYVPGSEYSPFSSHLNFLGSPVAYWYSIAGNGFVEEHVPTKSDIELEIATYIQEGLRDCAFDSFYAQGFNISIGEPEVNVQLFDNNVEAEVNSPLFVSRGEDEARKTSHSVEIRSKLGKFYNIALDIYDEEKQKAFLEDYAVDVLYNYAPVSGIEVQCGPKIWLTRDVTKSLRSGLEANFQTIKLAGNYYSLSDPQRKYFVHEKRVDEAVNFLYFQDWPSRIEIAGDGVDDEIMMVEAVGTQAGMGVMGFCYVPYHFVYDMEFPVMVQIYDTEEMFQFPLVVVVDKNVPRNALPGTVVSEEEEFDVCEFSNKDVTIHLYDSNLNAVDGNVSFECFDQTCRLGETTAGVLRTSLPACVNGYVHVRADGFADTQQLLSSNSENTADVVLEREYNLHVVLKVGGREITDETAIISFARADGNIKTATLPELDEVKLSEGNYEIKVYVYGNSSVMIPASSKSQCVEVPREGLLGLFGSTKENCFDINLPATKIESALIGGGTTNSYLLESELRKGTIVVNADRLPVPNSLDALAQNFELFDTKRVWVEFDEPN